jgi:hypothetical protein
LVQAIVGVNNDSSVRQDLPFAHYGKTFEEVKRDQQPFLGRSVFICAYVENELIGFLKLVICDGVATILTLLPKASQRDRRPANALIAKAVEVCDQHGISYLVYGLLNYGNKSDSSLRDFKIRNGFIEILVPRFYVPLTMWGFICIKVGLHRGLVGLLPLSCIKLALRFRAKCYDVARQVSRCSSMLEQPNCDRHMECSNPPAGSNS